MNNGFIKKTNDITETISKAIALQDPFVFYKIYKICIKFIGKIILLVINHLSPLPLNNCGINMDSLFPLDNTNNIESDLLTLNAAAEWASDYLRREVSVSNIAYLTQYGKINKFKQGTNSVVSRKELEAYYKKYTNDLEKKWSTENCEDIHWQLAFDLYREKDTTKHVHRLHPYKGKFIPQLVEYFLDQHTDELKREVYFNPGNLVIDPFCGSGTTLVQANELDIDAIGIDISPFNTQISNIKITPLSIENLKLHAEHLGCKLHEYASRKSTKSFDAELRDRLSEFNKEAFPSPEYKRSVQKRKINEESYSKEKLNEFLCIFYELKSKYDISIKQQTNKNFLDTWYVKPVRDEIDYLNSKIKSVKDDSIKQFLEIIFTRTVRTCRATTHTDLGTLKTPTIEPYYCKKHYKICKPLFTIQDWWNRYCKDTITRLSNFEYLRTQSQQICLVGDSRIINIEERLSKSHPKLASKLKVGKADGIFSSPPYVGMIDYHEQHAYAYELLSHNRNDNFEIGPLFKGQGKAARESYVEGISQVLNNCKKFLKPDFNIFLVAGDKYNLYPSIAQKANLEIAFVYKRPVLNRTERNKNAYSESIFHLKTKGN
ncbi:MAG: DNA methyltransferase [Rhodobacteraceae bacterium]|nr:DNA methyltransferase [Paracoccaceae bacterium]